MLVNYKNMYISARSIVAFRVTDNASTYCLEIFVYGRHDPIQLGCRPDESPDDYNTLKNIYTDLTKYFTQGDEKSDV